MIFPLVVRVVTHDVTMTTKMTKGEKVMQVVWNQTMGEGWATVPLKVRGC
jgi:hypothetical protein